MSYDFLHNDIPEKSEVVPSESTLRFSELSAVPIEASDSRVSSSDARGSRVSISKVNSSLQRQILSRLTKELRTHDETQVTVIIHANRSCYFCKFTSSFLQNSHRSDTLLYGFIISSHLQIM